MIKIERVRDCSQYIIDTLNDLLPQLGADYAMDESLLKEIVGQENVYLFVAKKEDAIVGTLTLAMYPIPTGLKAWIEDVIVDENCRGLGIARKLVDHAIMQAKERNVVSLSLSSRPERVAANKLYQAMNFRIRETNLYRYNPDE